MKVAKLTHLPSSPPPRSESGAATGLSGGRAADRFAFLLSLEEALIQADADGATSARPILASPADLAIERVHRIAEDLASRVRGELRTAPGELAVELRLDAPNLGRIRVEMTASEERTVQAVFTVEKAETGLLLDRHMHQFIDALARCGWQVDRASVAVASKPFAETAATDDARPSSEAHFQE
jgi:flagellar hook-length control protein FliK